MGRWKSRQIDASNRLQIKAAHEQARQINIVRRFYVQYITLRQEVGHLCRNVRVGSVRPADYSRLKLVAAENCLISLFRKPFQLCTFV